MKKDRMRRHFFLTIHHMPDGSELPTTESDFTHFDVSPLLTEIDCIFGSNLRYRKASLEIGEKKGKFHVHAYVELYQSMRWSTVCNKTAHFFAKVKTVEHSSDFVEEYCGKEEDPTFLAGPWVFGIRRKQRKDESEKTALDEVIDRLLDGNSISEIAYTYPKTWIIFGRRIKEWLYDAGLHEHPLTKARHYRSG